MTNDFCKYIYGLFGCVMVVLLLPGNVKAQAGLITLKATVSETVALSVLPNSTHGDVNIDVVNSGRRVRLTLSGSGAGSAVIRVPLLVRSNIGFKISGTVESETARLTELSVLNVRATGRLVSPEAVNNLEIQDSISLETGSSIVLSGPRASLGGTLESPNNALQITLLIRIKPKSVGGWLAHLTFSHN